MTSVACCILACMCMCMYASQVGAFSNVTGLLAHVNKLRNAHGAQFVSYSTELEVGAQAWAEHLASIGQLQHSSGSHGENLAAIYSTAPWTVAIDMWYAEGTGYDYSTGAFDPQRGHFTALVWAATTSIGFGVASGGPFLYVVMWFAPAGNVLTRFIENVRPLENIAKPSCTCIC